MEPVADLVVQAQAGSLEAFGRLVRATQVMAYVVALAVLRDRGMAEDAAQDAYLRAFRHLGDLHEPAAFVSWLRRLVLTVALNMRRGHRRNVEGSTRFNGGDTAGLAADADGVFHALWIDSRTGVHQMWTATIAVRGVVRR